MGRGRGRGKSADKKEEIKVKGRGKRSAEEAFGGKASGRGGKRKK